MILGIDVGGTKTEAVLVNRNGEVLAFERGKGANYQTIGEQEAFERINGIVVSIAKNANIGLAQIEDCFVGAAGADFDYDYEIIDRIIKRLGLNKYGFDNDGLIALRSGTLKDPGILVTCGTGSINYAYNGREISRKGGFSQFFGEKLGAWYVSKLVASAATRSMDGRGYATLMKEMIEEKAGMSIPLLMNFEYHDNSYRGPEPVRILVSSLFEAANRNDLMAVKILVEIAEEVIGIAKSFLIDMEFEKPIKLILEGTVFKVADKMLIEMISNGLGDGFEVIVPLQDPVIGAALISMEREGWNLTDEVVNTLISQYKVKKDEFMRKES